MSALGRDQHPPVRGEGDRGGRADAEDERVGEPLGHRSSALVAAPRLAVEKCGDEHGDVANPPALHAESVPQRCNPAGVAAGVGS